MVWILPKMRIIHLVIVPKHMENAYLLTFNIELQFPFDRFYHMQPRKCFHTKIYIDKATHVPKKMTKIKTEFSLK